MPYNERQSGERYRVFTRRWWKDNPAWPNGLEPHAGRKRELARNLSREEAYEYCRRYNAEHNPGRYSVKAEFERQ